MEAASQEPGKAQGWRWRGTRGTIVLGPELERVLITCNSGDGAPKLSVYRAPEFLLPGEVNLVSAANGGKCLSEIPAVSPPPHPAC